MRVSIIDRYLLRHFLLMFLGVAASCATLLLLTEILQRFQDIANNDCPMDKAFLYFVNFLPFRIIQILPLATIISVLFSMGVLAHNREILAITASGIGPVRIAVPVISAGFVISLLALVLATFLVPYTETVALDLRRIYIENKGAGAGGRIEKENVFARGEGQRFYIMSKFSRRTPITMISPSILEMDKATGEPVSRLTATTATLINESDANGRTLWRFYNPSEFLFRPGGRLDKTIIHSEPVDISLESNLHAFLGKKRKPEEMGAWELYDFIKMLEIHGEETGPYRTDFWLKLLFPFASFIFVIGGFAFAMRAQVGSMVIGFAEGILFAILFYGLVGFTQAMGHGNVLPPFLSVLVPMLLFSALAVHFLRRSAYNMT